MRVSHYRDQTMGLCFVRGYGALVSRVRAQASKEGVRRRVKQSSGIRETDEDLGTSRGCVSAVMG